MPLIRSLLATAKSIAPAGVEWDESVVWLRGEHDTSTVCAVSEVLVRAIALDDSNLVLDLSEVSFMDAATVGLLVDAREHLLVQTRSLALRSPSRCARRVLEICGLSHLCDPEPIASYASEAAGALRSWIAIPATSRVEHRIEPPALATPRTLHPERPHPVAVEVMPSERAHGSADERRSSLARYGSP